MTAPRHRISVVLALATLAGALASSPAQAAPDAHSPSHRAKRARHVVRVHRRHHRSASVRDGSLTTPPSGTGAGTGSSTPAAPTSSSAPTTATATATVQDCPNANLMPNATNLDQV